MKNPLKVPDGVDGWLEKVVGGAAQRAGALDGQVFPLAAQQGGVSLSSCGHSTTS